MEMPAAGELKEYEFEVKMSCSGCTSAIERALYKMKDKGVENVRIVLSKQRVYVKSTMPPEEILAIIENTGRKASYIGFK